MASSLIHIVQNTAGGLITLVAAGLVSPSARADVIEIGTEGNAYVRAAAGAVAWNAVGASGETHDNAEVPAGALTRLADPPAPAVFAPSLHKAAQLAGISPALLEALVWQESRWHTNARSPIGALGLGQLMPGTARSLGVDPHDPEANLIGAARYLRAQLDAFDNNVELALAAYNAGPARVARAGRIPNIAETQAYVAQITARLASSTRQP